MQPVRLALWIAFSLVWLAPAPRAQGGYRTVEVPEVGLEYKCAKDYDAIPTEPSEEWIIAQWVERTPSNAKQPKQFPPKLHIVWIDRVPDAQPKTPTGDEPPPPPPGEEGEEEAPRTVVVERVNSTGRYLERFFQGWTPKRADEGKEKERDGMRAELSLLEHEKHGKVHGWMYELSDNKRICLFLGFCTEDDAQEQSKIWLTMARSARFVEPAPVDMTKWERHYERHPEFIDPAYRLQVRKQLVRGWEADDTENYIFVYSTKDQKLLGIMKRELEAIREEYEKLFPPTAPVTAVSTVRICKSRDEYFAYGGPQGSGGYWNSAEEELVFFDYDSLDEAGKKKKGTANSRIVLYHEAFHQYVYYSTGELPPHSWFNEGTGDFFSGANITGGKVKGIGVNPWRIALIQRGIADGSVVDWDEILRFEQPDFYRPDRRSMCYAQAWSLIYFLRESKTAQKHPQWSRINQTYFDALKEAFTDELAKLAPEPTREAKQEAGKAARARAVEVAFDGIDLRELDGAWRGFVRELKVPR